jgi:hypothetical protein
LTIYYYIEILWNVRIEGFVRDDLPSSIFRSEIGIDPFEMEGSIEHYRLLGILLEVGIDDDRISLPEESIYGIFIEHIEEAIRRDTVSNGGIEESS